MKNQVNEQIESNIPNGKILSIYLKNGLRVNGRFTVWKKYNDNSKFLDIAQTSSHFLIYDFSIKDYRVIVKKNISKICANKMVLIAE
jgi:sRNA-binding regulator protein Hfq